MTRTVEIEHGGHAFEVGYDEVGYPGNQYWYTLRTIKPSAGVPHQYGGDISEWLIDHAWKAYNEINSLGIKTILEENRRSEADAIALAREAMDD